MGHGGKRPGAGRKKGQQVENSTKHFRTILVKHNFEEEGFKVLWDNYNNPNVATKDKIAIFKTLAPYLLRTADAEISIESESITIDELVNKLREVVSE